MQTLLVLIRIKVRPPQPYYRHVVPPQKETYGALDNVRKKNIGPELPPENVLRCKLHQRWNIIPLVVETRSPGNINRYQNGAADSHEHEEDIPHHPHKPQEDDGIQPNRVD